MNSQSLSSLNLWEITRVPILLFLLLSVVVARAHGPYDSSAQLILRDNALELSATLGMEGAKQVLLNAGLPETDAASALMSRGPSTLHDLPVELASRFFELKVDGESLQAERLQVISDGLEANFTATFAGPHSGDLEVQARYFDGVEAMKPGAFVAMDENRNVKGTATFSRASSATVVKGESVATPAQPAAEPEVTPARDIPASTEREPAREDSEPATTLWWIAGLVLLAGSILIVIRMLRRAR